MADKEIRNHTAAVTAERADAFLAELWPDLSRSRIQSLLKEGLITIDGKKAKPSQAIMPGADIAAAIPPPEPVAIVAEDIPLDILYEDADILVVNKARGMVVHPAAGNYQGTLVNALMHYCDTLSGINGELRPGIVHRLDKDTTGILVVAKHDRAHRALTEAWPTGEVERYYRAIVHNNMTESAGDIQVSIGRHPHDRKKMAVTPGKGRYAWTKYQVLEHYAQFALVEAQIMTGRTHQIRVSMKHIGHPVVGDVIYGPKKPAAPILLLHCTRVAMKHPIRGDAMVLEAPVPLDFQHYLDNLRCKGSLT